MAGFSGEGTRELQVNDLPNIISNTHVVSAEGLDGVDIFHFTAESYRTYGARYSDTMVSALGLKY
ncbi:MAG: hypothetical protein JXR91_05555 [Deltaproteobacteria bacterium]|nr:hypothetical protein [Deltaproteobacteria bacterium]